MYAGASRWGDFVVYAERFDIALITSFDLDLAEEDTQAVNARLAPGDGERGRRRCRE